MRLNINYLVLFLLISPYMSFAEDGHQKNLPLCNANLKFPSEPTISDTTEQLDKSLVAKQLNYSGIYHDQDGAGFYYQVFCTVYHKKTPKFSLKRDVNGYYQKMKSLQTPDTEIVIQPFLWLSEFNGYQKATLKKPMKNGRTVYVSEGLFSTAGANTSVSVRLFTNDLFSEKLDNEHRNLISSLELTLHPLKISEVVVSKNL